MSDADPGTPPVPARRIRQRIGFVLVAAGAVVVMGADYFLGATEFFTPPRIVGLALVACGAAVQGWVVLTRRRSSS